MGIAFSVVAIAMLIGTPINGALLAGDQTHEFTWWKAIVFSGVRVPVASLSW
jgi:MFS transporter, MCT family, solute carrier family 16 (monocarboxylic acid transporters), member 10